MTKCPNCNGDLHGVEYAYGSQFRYDGISEWRCDCGYRVGRWTGKKLKEGEIEYPHGAEEPFVPLPCDCGDERHPKYETCFDCFQNSND